MNDLETIRAARAAYMKEWRTKNKAHLKAYRKQWREENPEKAAAANERVKQWQKENPEKVKTYQNRYWLKKAAAMGVEE